MIYLLYWLKFCQFQIAMATVVWQFASDLKNMWQDMDASYTELYEAAFRQYLAQMEYDVGYAGDTKFYHYHVDYQTMKQKNVTTGKVRQLRRDEVTHGAQ